VLHFTADGVTIAGDTGIFDVDGDARETYPVRSKPPPSSARSSAPISGGLGGNGDLVVRSGCFVNFMSY